MAIASLLATLLPAQTPPSQSAPSSELPRTRVYDVKQNVTVKEIPKDAKRVRLWIPIPDDAAAQKLLDMTVTEAPGTWSIVAQPEHGNRFLYVEANPAGKDSISVVTTFTVRRDPMKVEIDPATAGKLTDVHKKQFAEYLDKNAPNMAVDDRIQKMADAACGTDDNVFSQVTKLWNLVADSADHYSKDATKPKCGRGSAEDCLAAQGGCCTDLHALFIALARARGIPTRMYFGYRLQAKNAGKEVDPGYRCWVEYFVPNHGWIATDIVVGDAGDREARPPYITALDERRIVLYEGRNLELNPKQDGPRVNNVVPAYGEIDGKPVPLLPDKDGKPSPMVRTVFFTERGPAKTAASGAAR
jgi:transglutaminase-like putative cysteine protease